MKYILKYWFEHCKLVSELGSNFEVINDIDGCI